MTMHRPGEILRRALVEGAGVTPDGAKVYTHTFGPNGPLDPAFDDDDVVDLEVGPHIWPELTLAVAAGVCLGLIARDVIRKVVGR